jgi:UDPglucose 6-dehydrogenase
LLTLNATFKVPTGITVTLSTAANKIDILEAEYGARAWPLRRPRGKTIALLGLAFKPNTDDMRDAPSIDIVSVLEAKGAKVRAFDPESIDQARPLMPHVTFCNEHYDCVQGADALVIVTEWDAFRALDLKRVKEIMKHPALVDLRNIYRPVDMQKHGFIYSSIGRA